MGLHWVFLGSRVQAELMGPPSLINRASAPARPSKAFLPLQLQTDDEKMGNSSGCQEWDEKTIYASVNQPDPAAQP